MSFTSVKRQKAYLQIVEQIIESIRNGTFGTGDRLPSVRDLETKFGVSRPTVREALSALELSGIIEVRNGQGAFVVNSSRDLGQRDPFELDQGESVAEVLEVRLVLEPEAARLAARRATEEDLEALARILQGLRTTIADGKPAINYDIQFHLAIARASQNAVIYKIMQLVTDYLNQGLWRSLRAQAWARKDLGPTYLNQHDRTLEAIRLRDTEAAMASMRAHLRQVQRDLFAES